MAKRAAERKRYRRVTELPLPPKDAVLPLYRLPPVSSGAAPTATSSRATLTATSSSAAHRQQQEHRYSIGTSAPTTTSPAATLAAAITTRMAPVA
ncbi:hypothetical protein EMCRGX_G031565 [Ephydatia muelleri]